MKPFYLLFIIGFACQSVDQPSGDFKLLPYPQKFEILGKSNFASSALMYYYAINGERLPPVGILLNDLKETEKTLQAQIVFQIDTTLRIKKEGYLLNISEDQVSITAKDKAGLFYAFSTLHQLLQDANDQQVSLPMCRIEDFPMLSYRAIHLDIKHHREKLDYYYQLMDRLSSYKINGIITEFEDKIQYKNQPIVGARDALSIAEWSELSDYAMDRNIEISPLIQGLGHASFILKHDEYHELRDDPESDWAFNPLDERTYDLQFDLYEDAIEATPGGSYLHIGGDEVHTTGRNSGKSALELQLIWLNRVCAFAAENNRIPIFWDDMPLKQAGVYRPMFNTRLTNHEVDSIWDENEYKLLEFLDQFPKNCIYMRWNYSSPEAIGNGKAMEWFTNHDLQVMGATAGQTRWVLMPQNESNMENIRSFAASSINKGLNGLLLTLWDDDSPHFELYIRGILAFSEYSWSGDKRSKEDIKSAYRQREFSYRLSDVEYAFIDQLEKPVAFWKNALLKNKDRNRLRKMDDQMEALIELPRAEDRGEWSKNNTELIEWAKINLEQTDSIAFKISIMKEVAGRNSYTLDVYEQVNKLARFTPSVLLVLYQYDNAISNIEKQDALKRITKISKNFEALRHEFELVYSKTRILEKPADYVLDQDHHSHLANQSVNFDWQFSAEILFIAKIDNYYINNYR